jgi:Kef-type K+ transport system membrane component KefB
MDSADTLFRLPLHDPVAVITLAMVVFLIAPVLFHYLHLPRVVGFIAAGALFGPNGLKWLERDQTIVLLGTVGLLYLMFIAAVEIDLHDFSRHRARSALFGVLGFAVPLVLGFAVSRLLGFSALGGILLGSMLSSHTLLAYPTASRLGIAKNQAVMVAVGATIITDLLALLVLAGIAAGAQGKLTPLFWLRLGIFLAGFSIVVLKILPRLANWFMKRAAAEEGIAEYTFVLASLFAAALLAQLAGIEPIIGAFLAGLALNPLLPEGQPLTNRLNFFSETFFTPFFLFSVGMLVDLRVITSGPRSMAIMVGMIATVLPAKWLAAWITRRRCGYSAAEAWTMFGLSVPQAAATLAIALIGYQVKLFDTATLNATIMVILITSTLGPSLVDRFGTRVALDEQHRPFKPSSEPQRILIPILKSAHAESLVKTALLFRTPGSKEPLLPAAVVPGEGRTAAAGVVQAEKVLSHAVVQATAAGVRAVPLTRVARDFVSGVARGIAESRATTVLLEWSGRRDRRRSTFNNELDRLVARTDQLVVISRMEGALATLHRIVVVVPPEIDRTAGFDGTIRVIKLMASRLTADVRFFAVGDGLERLEARIDRVRQRIRRSFESVPDWGSLGTALGTTLPEDELLVLISERPGLAAWRRELDQLPRRLVNVARNLWVMFPSTIEADQEHDDHVRVLVNEALRAERLAVGLADVPIEEAVERLLRREFGEDAPRLLQATTALAPALANGAAEVMPGVVFLLGRMEELATPLLFLGVNGSGVEVRGATQPVRVVCLVLAPLDHRKRVEAYVEELRHLFCDVSRVDQLSECTTIPSVAQFFQPEERRRRVRVA